MYRVKNFLRMDFWVCWLLSVSILLVAGFFYRGQASHLQQIVSRDINLPVPLSKFPLMLNGWSGEDVPIPEQIQRVAGNDDFLNRFYTTGSNNQWANVYIAYSAHPRTMLGHKPQVCYVAGGWVLEGSEKTEFFTRSGKQISCLIHRFYKPYPDHSEIVVLSFYILNGRVTQNESGFSGLGWRSPNIEGDLARYVAQVQISSVLENSIRAIAAEITDLILEFFPDSSGKIKAVEYMNGDIPE